MTGGDIMRREGRKGEEEGGRSERRKEEGVRGPAAADSVMTR